MIHLGHTNIPAGSFLANNLILFTPTILMSDHIITAKCEKMLYPHVGSRLGGNESNLLAPQ